MRHSRALPLALFVLVLSVGRLAHAQVPITLDRPSEDPPVPRLRIGAEFGGGISYGAFNGGALGVFGQIGAQITREVGVFYQPALLVYGLGGSGDVGTVLSSSHSAMVDLTVRNVAQVGIGGGLDVGRFAWCDEDTAVCSETSSEVHPSLTLRAAFLVGFVRERTRWGIPIGLQVHTMLWDHRALNHLMLTVGLSRY